MESERRWMSVIRFAVSLLLSGLAPLAHAGNPQADAHLREAFDVSHAKLEWSPVGNALREGADPDLSVNGTPVLYIAARRGEFDIAEGLLAAGAKPVPCAGPRCPIRAIVTHVDSQSGRNMLHDMAGPGGSLSAVRWLLQQGADVDAKAPDGATPLMVAAYQGRFEIAQALLDSGAQPLLMDNNGHTAKMYALQAKHADIVKLLEAHGADEYAGATLPRSAYDGLLRGKDQRDVTSAIYHELSGLPLSLRFFEIFDHVAPLKGPSMAPYVAPPPHGIVYYVVLRGGRVVGLTKLADSTLLGLELRTPKDALALVRTLSGTFSIAYAGTKLTELPSLAKGNCMGVEHLSNARKNALIKVSVKRVKGPAGTAFIVSRNMLAPDLIPSFGGSASPSRIDSVMHVRERVDTHGSDTLLDAHKVLLKPFALELTCGLR